MSYHPPVLQGPLSWRLTERKPSEKPPPRASRKTDPAEPASTSGLSVLIVDDAQDTREMYALYFQHVGARGHRQ
jgi:hypoxanthine phosphoribosyltransferase